jgi:hypothetical protein
LSRPLHSHFLEIIAHNSKHTTQLNT